MFFLNLDLHNLKDYKATRQLTLNGSNFKGPSTINNQLQNENKNLPYFPSTTITISRSSQKQESKVPEPKQQQSRYTNCSSEQNLSGYLTPRSSRKSESSTGISPPLMKISHTKSYNSVQQQKILHENRADEDKIRLQESRNLLNRDNSENRFRKAQLTISATQNPETIVESGTSNNTIGTNNPGGNNNGLNLMGHFKNLVNVRYFVN